MRLIFMHLLLSIFLFNAVTAAPVLNSPSSPTSSSTPNVKLEPPVIDFSEKVPGDQKQEITRVINEHIEKRVKYCNQHHINPQYWSGIRCTVDEGWKYQEETGHEVVGVDYLPKPGGMPPAGFYLPIKYLAKSGGEECCICKHDVYILTSMCTNKNREPHDRICPRCYADCYQNKKLDREDMICPLCRLPVFPVGQIRERSRKCGDGPSALTSAQSEGPSRHEVQDVPRA